MKQKTKKLRFWLLASVLIFSCLLSYQYGLSSVPAAGPYYLDVPFGTASYYVGKFDNGTTYMVDKDTWQCTWWSTNASAVILACLGNVSAFETIVCQGDIDQLDTTLTFTTNDVTFIFDALYWNTADVIGINITASRVRIRGQTLYRGATPTKIL